MACGDTWVGISMLGGAKLLRNTERKTWNSSYISRKIIFLYSDDSTDPHNPV